MCSAASKRDKMGNTGRFYGWLFSGTQRTSSRLQTFSRATSPRGRSRWMGPHDSKRPTASRRSSPFWCAVGRVGAGALLEPHCRGGFYRCLHGLGNVTTAPGLQSQGLSEQNVPPSKQVSIKPRSDVGARRGQACGLPGVRPPPYRAAPVSGKIERAASPPRQIASISRGFFTDFVTRARWRPTNPHSSGDRPEGADS